MILTAQWKSVVIATSRLLLFVSRYLAQNAAIWLADEVIRYCDHDTSRCQNDISWHLITQQSKGHNANNGSRIVARNGESTHIYYECVNFIACFQIICWFLQTLNCRGNEKYVLVLVQCHDGVITNSINLVCILHPSSTCEDQTDSSRSWSSHHDTGLEPEPNILVTSLKMLQSDWLMKC